MKFLVLIVATFFLFSCVQNSRKPETDVIQNINKQSNAEIQFDKEQVDFGIIPQDTLVTALYQIKNIGSDTLKIADIQPDCSCTSFYVSKFKIAPNDTASVKLNINTFHKHGNIEQYTVLVTNTKKKFYSLKNTAIVN